MRNWVIRKDRGEANVVAAAICNVITILVFYCMVSVMMDYTQVLERKNNLFTVCDRYLEQMMSTGYLSESGKDALTDALTQLGATDICFDDTTLLPGEYGDRITLSVSFEVEVKVHAITDFFSMEIQDKKVSTKYVREAVSYQ